MKVAIIGTVGVPANYGGFETLVENLLTYKQNQEIEYTVYCSSKSYKEKLATYKGAKLIYLPFKANGWQALIYDSVSLIHAYFTADIILALGGNLYPLPVLRWIKHKCVIDNFDGLDFAREKWSLLARIIIKITNRIAVKYSDIGISDNVEIQKFLKEYYKRDSVLIEYGGDNAVAVHDDDLLKKQFGLESKKYCFKVARIEPENNIEMILKAFCEVPSEKLVIVGNWDSSDFGKKMKTDYSFYSNIVILDPIYDSKLLNLLRSNCKIYIHGHSVGGTNPSLVEAMSLGLPLLAFDIKYNCATTEDKALYFNNKENLISQLNDLANINVTELGKTMFEIANRRYTWKRICLKYEELLIGSRKK